MQRWYSSVTGFISVYINHNYSQDWSLDQQKKKKKKMEEYQECRKQNYYNGCICFLNRGGKKLANFPWKSVGNKRFKTFQPQRLACKTSDGREIILIGSEGSWEKDWECVHKVLLRPQRAWWMQCARTGQQQKPRRPKHTVNLQVLFLQLSIYNMLTLQLKGYASAGSSVC